MPAMAARAGIEPMVRLLQACAAAISSESAETADAQLRAQELSRVAEIISVWPKLSGEFRVAVLAMSRSVSERQEYSPMADCCPHDTKAQ